MKPKRRSIRLPGYDYASAGWYFVTIVCHKRQNLFGEIHNGQMVLNAAGKMVEEWWNKIPEKFQDIKLGEFQIMPNHFHAIVENVGADPCVGPENRAIPAAGDVNINSTDCVVADPGACPAGRRVTLAGRRVGPEKTDKLSDKGKHTGSPLHRVVQWFKTMTTNEFIRNVKFHGWEPFENKIWQRNYYEHIIRNEDSYRDISNYIMNNPQNWLEDEHYSL
jgi:REP element-mobilizing transposase RayT